MMPSPRVASPSIIMTADMTLHDASLWDHASWDKLRKGRRYLGPIPKRRVRWKSYRS